jgi:hypothetical protein
MPARPSSQESIRDKSSMEVAHQEEKTTAILDGVWRADRGREVVMDEIFL